MESVIVFVLMAAISLASINNVEAGTNLIDIAKSLNLTSFVDAAKKVGLDKIINHEGRLTVFAPTNEAFENEKNYPSEVSLPEKIMFHVAWNEVDAVHIKNEMVLKTLLAKRPLRLNTYKNGTVKTANGRPIVSYDNFASNGVIHIISEVMSSVYKREGSVISEIEECCPHHSVLIDLVKFAGLYEVLDKRGPYTLLAPNNGAFAKLHPDYINHLKKNVTALRRVLLTHVIPKTVYTAGLSDGESVKTVSGAKLQVIFQDDDIKFDNATVILRDVTAANGAVHTIDEVLFPWKSHQPELRRKEDDRNTFVDALYSMGCSSFADALIQTRLDKVIEKGRFTVFAPDNESFEKCQYLTEPTTLEEKVRYFISRGVIKSGKLYDGKVLPTLLDNRLMKINVFQGNDGKRYTTIHGRPVSTTERDVANGRIYKLEAGSDISMDVSETSLFDEIKKHPKYSHYVNIMEMTGLGAVLSQLHYEYTVIVPNNNAFAGLDFAHGDLHETGKKLLLRHVIPGTIFSTEIKLSSGIISLGGTMLHFVNDSGLLSVNGVAINSLDMVASNGVFHEVSRLL